MEALPLMDVHPLTEVILSIMVLPLIIAPRLIVRWPPIIILDRIIVTLGGVIHGLRLDKAVSGPANGIFKDGYLQKKSQLC
jgi:hypothetical protein